MADAQVKNAADPRQVARAKKVEKERREIELEDLRAVLATDEGRRFIWRMISHCQVFGSVWSPNERIHYNAGVQDVGHWLLAEVSEADEIKILEMMQENFAAERLQRQQTDAERTPSVTDGDRDDAHS